MILGVGKKAEAYFMQLGFDVLAVRSLNPAMSDEEIFSIAQAENRIIITMDKDFGALIYHSFTDDVYPGVVLLRMEDATAEEKIEALKMIFAQAFEELPNHFSVYKKGQLRIRK